MGDGAAFLQDVFADGETDVLLLLVADEGKVGVEEIVGGVAVALLGEVDDVDEHVGEPVAGHGAVGSTLKLEVEEERAVAGEDGDGAHGAFVLEGAEA